TEVVLELPDTGGHVSNCSQIWPHSQAAYRSSQARIVLVTSAGSSAWTKCPAPGTVVSVRSFSTQSHVPFSAGASSAVSPSPWIISTGHCTFFTGDVSSVYGSRG